MSILQISLFGHVCITDDHGAVMPNVTRTTQALLAYLLLIPHRSQPRDVLADVFWGDRSQERARSCLKTALWRLRCVLEPAGTPLGTYLITTPNGDIGFNWQSSHWLDVTAFEKATQHIPTQTTDGMQLEDVRDLEAAVNLYTGELLEGFYDDWALRERERLRHVYLNTLAYLMRFYRRQGAYEKALENGRKILDLDPLREEIHREMMQLYVETGQRALAIQQYAVCRDLLNQELGILPMEETQALYAQVAPASDRLQTATVGAITSPYVRHVLQQLRSTLRNLDRAHDQLQQTIQLMEKLDGHAESSDRRSQW